ncbi:MAG: phospho-sugar mutase [Metamycoplasmataceae bacterium]
MKKLEFGTAGIRGVLGKGENNLNSTHVIRIIEGFAKYLIENFPDAKTQGVVIGRDNRRESKNFSETAAFILSNYEINVHYNENIAPTPFISYATRMLGAVGAINITASHNPKEYNGIKLYNSHGCQLLPKEIYKLESYFEPYDFYLNTNINFNFNKFINCIPKSLMDSYLEKILKIGGDISTLTNIKVAYTPQHGTGATPVKTLFKKLNIKAFYEEREMIEDSEFTYSENPNPEVEASFNHVLKVAKDNDCDIVLVTDPDSDRVGAAIKHNNEYKIITGNETAILIFNYLINQIPKENLNKYYLIYSFVSSSLPRKIAEKNGLKVYVTETGFKWIGSLVDEIFQKNPEQKFLFAFEESYGSLIDDSVARDKDAIQSVIILTKIASYYKDKGFDLIQVLDNVYNEYGFVESSVISLNLLSNNHLLEIKKLFTNLKIEGAKFLDYNKGIGLIEPNDMLVYEFLDGSWISLRPSGTEAKIKIYLFFINKDKEKSINQYNKYFKLLSKLYFS